MQAEIRLVIGNLEVAGEITTELVDRTAYFVPWCSSNQFQKGQPFPLYMLPKGAKVVVADKRQFNKIAVVIVGFGLVPQVPDPKGETKRVTLSMETTDLGIIEEIRKRDGQTQTAWMRSAVRKEMTLRSE